MAKTAPRHSVRGTLARSTEDGVGVEVGEEDVLLQGKTSRHIRRTAGDKIDEPGIQGNSMVEL